MKKFYRKLPILLFLAVATIKPEINAQVDVILQLTNPKCGGFATGSIYAIPISGQAPYTYHWSTGSSANPINGLPAGNYTVTVTDFNGSTGTAAGMLTAPPKLEVGIKVTECGVPGTMVANISGGTPPLKILWSNGSTNATITNLQAGQYCITVTDKNSCAFQTCEMTGPDMSIKVETDTAFCGTGTGGSAYASATGGVPPYDYHWNNGATGDTISNLPPGEYIVTVEASNGCIEIDTGTVVMDSGSFDLNFDVTYPGCMGNASGSITAVASNGVPPYRYRWNTGDTTKTIDDLAVGTYHVSVSDSIGCISIDSVVLILADVIEFSFVKNDPTCFGSTNGNAATVVQNGTPPFNYLWSTGDTTAFVDDLSSGTYTVFITDSLNCLGLDSITLHEPPILELEFETENLSSCGAMDGSASVSAIGGAMPYSFLWSNGATTDSIGGLSAGKYFLSLTDANGCLLVDSITIDGPSALDVAITGTDLVCWKEATGILEVVVANGSPPFSYEWSNGDTSHIISDLEDGWFFVTVTSSEGCTGVDSFEIKSNPEINISETINHVSCFGFNNGSINVAFSGGTSPINILWGNGSNSTIRNNLFAGMYEVTVSDAVGCSAVDSFEVLQPNKLELAFNNSSGSCGANGFAIAIVTGGNTPYKYLWETGDNGSFIDNLAPGNYDLTVTDAKGCSVTGTAIIPDYPAIDLQINGTNTSCNGNSNGMATAVAAGGTPPLSFLWNNGATSAQITGLTPGTYTVTVTDAQDCTVSDFVEIELGAGLDVSINGEEYICEGQMGTLTAVATGGTSFYSYLWSNGKTTQTINNLSAGFYSVTVSDPFGCTGESSMTLLDGGDYYIISQVKNVNCFGGNTGRIEVEVFNAQPVVQYNWSNGATTPVLENLLAGNYSITVSDFTGCTKEIGFNVSQPPLLELEATGVSGTCGNLGSVESAVQGGTMPYSYLWSNGETDPEISILDPGSYTLTVTDAKGCKAIDTAIIDVIPSVSCNVMLMQPVSSINGSDGQLFAMVEFGSPPYEYKWSNGQTNPTISNLFFGNYTVTVTDADDCMTTCNFFLLNGARIGNLAWHDADGNGIQNLGELGIEDVTVELEGMDSYGNMVDAVVSTDAQGRYSFNVVPGNYRLTFTPPSSAGFLTSPMQQGGNVTTDSDIDPTTNQTGLLSISGGQDNQNIDAGFFIPITCDNVTDGGSLCCDQSLCEAGDQPTIINSGTEATGGTGILQYLWMYSEQPGPFDPQTWTPLANSNSPEFIPAPLNVNTYFVRRARRSGCVDYLETNVVEIKVNDFDLPFISGPDTICVGEPVVFTVNDFGDDATYNWFFENGQPNTSDLIVSDSITWDETGNQAVSLTIDINGCTLAASDSFQVTENPQICGFYPLILNGELTTENEVILDWRYPVSTSLLRTFLVEWAHNNDNFMPLGGPDMTENMGDLTRYFHTHSNPLPGTNKYRVILKDSEGNELISNVVEFQLDSLPGDRPALVHIYPNPFKDLLLFEINDRFDGLPITVDVFNTLGQKITHVVLPDNETMDELDVSAWASGTYFFFIKYGGKPQKIMKMVK